MTVAAQMVNLAGTAELKLVEAVAGAMPSGQVRRLPTLQSLHASYRMVLLLIYYVCRQQNTFIKTDDSAIIDRRSEQLWLPGICQSATQQRS